jgi:hypothetical protein
LLFSSLDLPSILDHLRSGRTQRYPYRINRVVISLV